jgi:thiol-disulfide isomerase/thioredoxin
MKLLAILLLFAALAHAQSANFLVKNEQGKVINTAAQKGKVIFLNFWALSCAPCKAEMRTIDQLREHFKNDTNVLILPVDVDSDLPNSTKYMQQHNYGLHVYTIASVVPKDFFQGMLPTTVVIGKDGKIARFTEGGNDYCTKEFIDFMEGLRAK